MTTNAPRRKFFGAIPLEWSWPLQAGLRPTTTAFIPFLPDIGRDLAPPADVPTDAFDGLAETLAPQWGRHYDEGVYRVFDVGIRFMGQTARYHIDASSVEDHLENVGRWLAWYSEEPFLVEERSHIREAPLWVRSEGRRYIATRTKLEYAGHGKRAASLEELQAAFLQADTELPVANSLWTEANTACALREDRRAVITAVSAAEVSIENAIGQTLAPSLTEEAVKLMLKSLGGIDKKRQMLEEVRDDFPTSMPSTSAVRDLAGIRNSAIHSGTRPDRKQTLRVMEVTRRLVETLAKT